jgi:hypothetical protein
MVLIANPSNITLGKCNMKPIQKTKVAEKPQVTKFDKNIQGKGLAELTDKLKGMKVKDSMKNIRITM